MFVTRLSIYLALFVLTAPESLTFENLSQTRLSLSVVGCHLSYQSCLIWKLSIIMSLDDKPGHFLPLNNSNYTEWSIRMEAKLVHKGLWDNVLCETDVEGKTEDEVKDVVTKWHGKCTSKKMVKTRVEIILLVEDSQLAHVRNRDLELIWIGLKQVHNAQGLATRLVLQRKFLTSVKGMDVMSSSGLAVVKAMAFRLMNIGVNLTDKDQILALTMGLNVLYKSFVISLDSTQSLLLTLNYVMHRLLNEEVRHGIRDALEL